MELLLWRHAEAADGFPDEARALTPKGRRQADLIAAWLKERQPRGLRVLVSPALRAQQTAAAFTKNFETDPRVGTGASVDELFAAAGWPDGPGAALVVGHQPTLGHAAALLLTGTVREWSMKKGALWWFTCRSRGAERLPVLKAAITAELAGDD